jgi:hypothetical protein
MNPKKRDELIDAAGKLRHAVATIHLAVATAKTSPEKVATWGDLLQSAKAELDAAKETLDATLAAIRPAPSNGLENSPLFRSAIQEAREK